MPPKKEASFTGLRSTGGSATLTVPQFPMLRVNVGRAPMFESAKRLTASLRCPNDGGRVKRIYVCEQGGEMLSDSECVKTYEWEGQNVPMDADELDRLKLDSDSEVSLVAFMGAENLPVEYVEKTQVMWPTTKHDAEGYALIAALLREGDKVLVGTMIDHGTTRAIVVRWSEHTGTLIAQVLNHDRAMRWGHVEAVKGAMENVAEPSAEMLAMAGQVFSAIPSDFDFGSVEDEYADRLEAAVKAKAEGGEFTVEEAEAPAAPAVDLMAALKASAAAATKAAPAKAKASKSRAKVTAA